MDTNNNQGLADLTQLYSNTFKELVPPVFTTTTPSDFVPDMNKLTSQDNLDLVGAEKQTKTSIASSALMDAAATLEKKTIDLPMTTKEFSKLTIGQIYDNTIKTVVAIINDFSVLVSEKEVITNTEFRRRLLGIFILQERRMYVGVVLIILSFILYFIDSSA
jgi:hypothetical protein